MRRITIMGPSGAGKSTLARTLGDMSGYPVYHLDQLYWKPNWVESSREQFKRKHEKIMELSEWIIDGNYSSTYDSRLANVDTVILLDFPRRIHFYRVLKRLVKHYGKNRPDMGEGCNEQFDWEFLQVTWHHRKRSLPKIIKALNETQGNYTLITLHRPKEVSEFLKGLEGFEWESNAD